MKYAIVISLVILTWGFMGLLSYGAVLGYHQRAYPEFAQKFCRQDKAVALPTLFLGPIGLLHIAQHREGFQGFTWRCISQQEAQGLFEQQIAPKYLSSIEKAELYWKLTHE